MERINADLPDPKPFAELELAGCGVYRSVADLEAAEVAKQPIARKCAGQQGEGSGLSCRATEPNLRA
jgi:hypothetical protein